ncbi:amidase [Rhizoctonia solani]|uniref:Amidase n=1 Tax=Rhizoctonia solani TaxID=456999 RepID=A0A8H8P3E9_9AGAM|nr:amidase [Rhizoctonia solani]QRW24799.1 amidase [Rhizoctonia solani]
MTVSEHPSTLISSEHHNDSNNSKLAKNTWKVTAALKRDDRANRLKPYAHWGLAELAPPSSQKNITSLVHTRLTDRERSFLAIDATDLAQRLASRDSLARARELDTHISATGKVVGPLHGVPVSIKDHIAVKGEDTATGFVAWAGRKIAEEDATIVQILRQAGAIIYVKTTNPQALFGLLSRPGAISTVPQVILIIVNLAAAEVAVILEALLGMLEFTPSCSDIYLYPLNDIRVPSAWCGLYGLKPSSNRLPASGLLSPYPGFDNIHVVIGPMAHSARDLELFCRTISDYEPWSFDFGTLSVLWNSSVTQRKEGDKLVIGFFTDDGVVAPHPPIIERLHKTRDALIAAGHEVIDWVPMDHMQAFKLIAELFFLDGGEAIRAVLAESGEPAIPPLARHLPDSKEADTHTLAQSWAANVQRDQFRARALKHWNDTALQSKSGRPVDAILCPVAPTLAPPYDTTRWAGYTTYWNLLDLPSVVFPSGEPFRASTWESTNSSPSDEPRNPIDAFVKEQWDPEAFDGAPIGLQLVGRRWQEEKLLAMLKDVEDAVVRFEK